MAIQLTNDSVKMGYLLPMKNTGRKPNELSKYYALKIEDQNGGNEHWILLSQNDFISRPEASIEGIDFKLGRRYECRIGLKKSQLIKVRFCEKTDLKNGRTYDDGGEAILAFTDFILKRGEERAYKNQEDIPKQSFWSDLKD